jgi:hypothetical protein
MLATAMAMILTPAGAVLAQETIEWTFNPREALVATDQAPDTPFPIQLVLDDGSSEGDFGVGSPNAQQFLWFNSFTPGPGKMRLTEIWVLFSPGPNMAVGAPIEIVVYHDTDADPTNGAVLMASFTETIQAVDGVTFSVYNLSQPVVLQDPQDVLIGVINRFVVSGVTSTTRPAALDTTSSQGRSWLAVWTGDPPSPPVLPSDNLLTTIDTFIPGNWMIRAYGTQDLRAGIPTLSHLGLLVLIALLATAGVVVLMRIRQ